MQDLLLFPLIAHFLNQTEDSIYEDQEIYGFYRTSEPRYLICLFLMGALLFLRLWTEEFSGLNSFMFTYICKEP